ncbi:hypothetical protein EQG63_00635 [Flavobacterium amnicola]|uniref:Peptidylprolyl isomerase n=1 Tax=Flavobacterium amnicola TaxID=2506422 RepID=A0A4Q1K7D0_9FLAO|nr:hypothetical protein [Flavobacterium amnicola]RXR20469.1 hypothetical protein EQG63_00635 [Flavobacterium amnicola]
MKKIVSIFLFLLAFTFNAQAQTEAKAEVIYNAKAKSDLKDLVSVADISADSSLFNGIYKLFVTKHEQLANPAITAEEKTAITKMVTEKLIGSLSAEQYKAIADNPKLFQKLTSQ